MLDIIQQAWTLTQSPVSPTHYFNMESTINRHLVKPPLTFFLIVFVENGPDDLDHAVLAVGYGVLDSQPYWLVKNSWSSYWGNSGFVLMSMKDNNCGVTTDATYVTLA